MRAEGGRRFREARDRSVAKALMILTAGFAAGCSRRDMADQPKLRPLQGTSFFSDGTSGRPPVPATVPFNPNGDPSSAIPDIIPVNLALLEKGRQRFEIYCSPCHGRTGDGDGMVVHRGFPAPPSYFSDRIMKAPDTHIYSVIGIGFGRMYGYGDRVTPEERVAIVAYIRALQFSRNAKLSDAPPDMQSSLQKE